jgi:iron complex outermembrane receptor protein
LDGIIPVQVQSVQGAQEKDARLTGKIDLDYTLDPDNFLYAFVATGHKGGGINGDGTVFGAENVTDYEVGWKGTYFDNHLHTQLGGYYNRYDNFQLAIYVPALGAGEDQNAAGTTTTKGIEAQTQAAFGGLSFDLGTSYESTSIGSFYAIDSRTGSVGPCNPASGPANPAPPVGCQNLSGHSLPEAPHWTAQFGVQYAFDLGNSQTLTPRVDYGLVGSKWGSVFEVASEDHMNAENIFNAQLVYDRPDNWEITAYATNLFDLHYVATELLGNLAFAGPPRQFGLRISKAF